MIFHIFKVLSYLISVSTSFMSIKSIALNALLASRKEKFRNIICIENPDIQK